MGAKARQTIVEQLDWRIVVKEAMKVYDEALKLTNFCVAFAPIRHGYLLEQPNNVQRAEEEFCKVFMLVNHHLRFNGQVDAWRLKSVCNLGNLQALNSDVFFVQACFFGDVVEVSFFPI